MIKLLAFLLLSVSAFATTTVSGTLKDLSTGTVAANSFVRVYLRGCNGNQPRVNGTALISSTNGASWYVDFKPNSSGVISGTVYSTRDAAGTGNGDIECGGSLTAVWYGVQVYFNGVPGPEMPVHAKSGATLDLTNVTPISTTPVVTAPTGDSTYARIDGGNMPFASVSVSGAANAQTYPATGGTSSSPAFTSSLETNSGWFRQQASIWGFSIGGTYLEQFGTGGFEHAPGVCYGWAPGPPNANSPDVSFCRASAGTMEIGNGAGNSSGSLVLTKLTAGSLNNLITVDGTKYPLTTAGIQSAITDSPAGGTVLIVGQTVSLTGAGTELILINKPLRFICGGWGGGSISTLVVGSAVGATVDVIHIKGTAAMEGVEIANCQIFAQSGTPARHGINIDTTTFAISKVWIHNNYIGPLGGKAIVSTNPTPLTDGWYTSWIEMNLLWNGVLFQNAGDGIQMNKNVETGSNMGVDATFVAGAGKFVYRGNTVTNTVACLHIGNKVSAPLITENECEGNVSATGSNGAYMDLDGTTGSLIEDAVVSNNQITPIAVNIDPLRINFTTATRVINGNMLVRPGGTAVDIRVTANATAGTTFIDQTNYYSPTTDTQTQILVDGGQSRVCWTFPYSGVSAGGLGSGIHCTTTIAATAVNTPALLVGRVTSTTGTLMTAAKIVLSAGWGNTATVDQIAGTDTAFRFRITPNGTGIAANPTVTVTYSDGTWTNTPITALTPYNASGVEPGWIVGGSTNATTLILATNAVTAFTPVAATPISLMVINIGSPN